MRIFHYAYTLVYNSGNELFDLSLVDIRNNEIHFTFSNTRFRPAKSVIIQIQDTLKGQFHEIFDLYFFIN